MNADFIFAVAVGDAIGSVAIFGRDRIGQAIVTANGSLAKRADDRYGGFPAGLPCALPF
jgi:hypothetical protein